MKENLPVLLLKNLVLLPCQEVRLELNNELSKKIIGLAEKFYNNKLLVICPMDTLETNPSAADLPEIGVIAKIKSKIELPNGNFRIVLLGLNRVKVYNYQNFENNPEILESTVKRIYVDDADEAADTAVFRTLKNLIDKYIKKNPAVSNSVSNAIASITDLDMLTDIITNFLPFDVKKKVRYMNEFDYLVRANNLIKELNVEIEVIDLEAKIEDEIRDSFEKDQRDFILKQKISKLNEELGVNVDKQTEINLYNEKIDSLDCPERTKRRLLDEVRKYSYTSDTNPDLSVIRNYLDTILNLPWNTYSKDETDLKKIKRALDKSHFGLDEVKTRILEFMAIKKSNPEINAPIICLVGPPGTGKTTLGYSISKALNREFEKISVGGLNDATELTGHKRTYLGSSPGKIIQAIKKCGTANPLILIDEVDKMVRDFKGDPSAVLLDILDPSQNNRFVDNYVEEPFDLSKVLFVLTANDLKNIPTPLRDRLEIIEISSYTEYEKLDIAKKYLIPNIICEYNCKKIKITDEALMKIINDYTKESGVRGLDRALKKIFRNLIINDFKAKSLSVGHITDILGLEKYNLRHDHTNHIGTVNTLGVTPYGGIIINIESLLIPGSGKLILTGNIERTIEESIQVAISYVKSNAKTFGIDLKKMEKSDIHFNALNYSVKKDGTSGGIAFVTALISLLSSQEVSYDVGFTGEITLHGDIVKVGGIKEKIIGAYNNGFTKIYIPLENKNDLANIPDDIKNNMIIRCVSHYLEIYEDLFEKA